MKNGALIPNEFRLPRPAAARVDRLADVFDFSSVERPEVVSWAAPPSLDTAIGRMVAPPGRGRLLLKMGNRPSVSVPVKPHQRRTPRRSARHEQALAPPRQGRVSTNPHMPTQAFDLLALGDAARLAQVWEHALAASYRLGEHAGYRFGWLAGRDEEALAWQSIVTGYSAVLSQPRRAVLAQLRRPSNDPCTTACKWCSQCIRAQSVVLNLARYGGPDFPGTGFPATGHLSTWHAGSTRVAS